MLLGVFSYSVNSGGQLYLHLTSLQQMLLTMTPRACWKHRDGHVQLTQNSTGSHGSLAQELGLLRAEPRQLLPDMCHPWLFSTFIFWGRVSHYLRAHRFCYSSYMPCSGESLVSASWVLGLQGKLPMEDGNSNSCLWVCVASTSWAMYPAPLKTFTRVPWVFQVRNIKPRINGRL